MQKIIFVGAVVLLMGAQSTFGAAGAARRDRSDSGRISPNYRYLAREDDWKTTDLYRACEAGNSQDIKNIIKRLKGSGITLSPFDLGRYFRFVVHSDPLPDRFAAADCLLGYAAEPLYGMSAARELQKRFHGVDVCPVAYPNLSRIVSEIREMKQ